MQKMNYTLSYSQARQMVLNYLKELLASRDEMFDFYPENVLQKRTDRKSPTNTNDGRLILEIIHELNRERLIASGTGNPVSPKRMEWPNFWITEYGRQVLSEAPPSPYDPDGYLASLRDDIPGLDETIYKYVAEALECFRYGCLLASAVMIGVASERAINHLITACSAAITDSEKQEQFRNATGGISIKRKHNKLTSHLEEKKKDLSSGLRDGLDHNLVGVFNVIRQVRNDAGHAISGEVSQMTVHGNLLLFPGYCRYVYSLIEYFESNTPS